MDWSEKASPGRLAYLNFWAQSESSAECAQMQDRTAELKPMAKILADRDIRKLLGTVILNADPERLNPNGIEIRLGKNVLFQSTDEEKELEPGTYLKVLPGESVTISSFEDFVFTRQAIDKVFPGCDLMALITPTTTMMREGIMQSATKVDSGWNGTLNWGLRNSSIRDFILGYKEPIFKLTIFLLEGGEIPEIAYGERGDDRYQNTQGIARSNRQIPASIAKKHLIGSSVGKLDPAKQLREAGYPFDHISTELTNLHGKFEVVSKDVLLLKGTIGDEADKLSKKVDESQKLALEKVEHLFDRKILGAIGRLVGIGSVMYGAVVFLQEQGFSKKAVGAIAIIAGVGMWLLVQYFMAKGDGRSNS
jgi:deoxycytidine triphosphate deaminase